MRKIFTALLVMFFVINTRALAESKKDVNTIADFIIVNDVSKTLDNVSKKYNSKIPEPKPLEYIDNSLISVWEFTDKKVGVAAKNDTEFLIFMLHDATSESVTDMLKNDLKLPISDKLKDLLDTSKRSDKLTSSYFVKHENYFIILERYDLNDKQPKYNLSITVDELLFEAQQSQNQ